MATLIELIEAGLQYDSTWAIYAASLAPDAPARIGQTYFEGGGVLDGKRYVINGTNLGDALREWIDDDDEQLPHVIWEDFLFNMIEEGWIDSGEEE